MGQWLKNHMCVVGCMFMPQARNEKKFQTSWCHGSAVNIKNLCFKFKKIKRCSEIHETRPDVMIWHQQVVVNNLTNSEISFDRNFLETGASHKEDSWLRGGTCHIWGQNHRRWPFCTWSFFYNNHEPIKFSCYILEIFRIRLAFLYIEFLGF